MPCLKINTPRHEVINRSDRRSEAVEVYPLGAVEVGFEHVGEVAMATAEASVRDAVRFGLWWGNSDPPGTSVDVDG